MRLDKLLFPNVTKFCKNLRFKRLFATKPDNFTKVNDADIPTKLKQIFESHKYFDAADKDVLTRLFSTGEKKFNIIYNDKETFSSLIFPLCDKEFIKAVDRLSEKELEQSIKEVKDLYTTLPKIDFGTGEVLQVASGLDSAKLIILKVNQPETYKYLLNNPDKELVSSFLSETKNFNGSLFETLTIQQIKQILGIGTHKSINIKTDHDLLSKGWSAIHRYVESSDQLIRDAKMSKVLSEYLSRSKITETFSAFRGERDTGMFNSVKLDKSLALKTKLFILKNILKARKYMVHDYTGKYENYFAKKVNLFKYIMSKNELSLADAMQVVKFGDTKFKNQIINLIKQSKIKDTRFKSLTFDRNMAKSWTGTDYGSNTGILHNMSVEKDIEGMYSPVTNRQAEFVLNNSEKYITFQDVVYDAERDMFVVKSNISKV